MLSKTIVEIEGLASRRDGRAACERLYRVLSAFAADEPQLVAWCQGANSDEVTGVFTRLAAAMTTLMADPEVELSHRDFVRLTHVMPQIAHVFMLSGYGSSDHILDVLKAQGGAASNSNELNFANASDARKFLLCCSVYGRSVQSLIAMVRRDPRAVLASALGALAVHLTCGVRSQDNRNQLFDAIQWADSVTPTSGMLADLHRAWALCSYATTEHRHDVKRHLNRLIVNWLTSQGIASPPLNRDLAKRDRPKLVVACEVTGGGHVMSRCFEPFLEQLRQSFHVVLVVAEDDLGHTDAVWWDELVKFRWSVDRFADLVKLIADQDADLIYYPCVGMRLWSVMACNLRLAPLQIASLGHPATTQSSSIDYVIGGKTTAGKEACFSEQLVRLNSPGNLYRLTRPEERYERQVNTEHRPVRIAVCANLLKLNATFVAACVRIAERTDRPIEFNFMPNCVGMKWLVARRQLASLFLGPVRCHVHPRTRCGDYLKLLQDCDLYLSPFPFGGENSMLDALLQGLPAVTLTGDQPHSLLDARVMKAADLPEWLITDSVDRYVEAALRLINEEDTRTAISQQLFETDLQQRFADEQERYPTDFVDTMWSIYMNDDSH